MEPDLVQPVTSADGDSLASTAAPAQPPVFQPHRATLTWSAAAARYRSISGERPKHQRDSLRSRSLEGKPGTRRHKRFLSTSEVTKVLHRAMAACGEDPEGMDLEELARQTMMPKYMPSVFYRLLQAEGPEMALEAWQSAEEAHQTKRKASPTSRRGGVPKAHVAEQAVRRAFSDTWQYVQGDSGTRELLAKIEGASVRAFAESGPLKDDLWRLCWDGEVSELDELDGQPPSSEIEVHGLTPQQRKVAHQLARVLGLNSHSTDAEGLLAEVGGNGEDGKVLVMRPPRRRCGKAAAWAAPFTVAPILAAGGY